MSSRLNIKEPSFLIRDGLAEDRDKIVPKVMAVTGEEGLYTSHIFFKDFLMEQCLSLTVTGLDSLVFDRIPVVPHAPCQVV